VASTIPPCDSPFLPLSKWSRGNMLAEGLLSILTVLHESITPFFPRARSSKRAVRLISGIALDQCRGPERYRTRVPFLRLALLQYSINPTIHFFAGVVQEQNPASPWLRYRCNSVHPLQFRGHSSASQSGCVTCIRSEVQLFLPSPFYPHSSNYRAGAS
jgi:hypothetical protein